MRLLRGAPFDQWRDRSHRVVAIYGNAGDEYCGVFNVPNTVRNDLLRVIATAGDGWDHVSISIPGVARCPIWDEVQLVKRAFFKRDEWAIEYHPPESDNRSLHDYCLHLWRPLLQVLPLPDPMMVAPPQSVIDRMRGRT